jgi:hypothetical protein
MKKAALTLVLIAAAAGCNRDKSGSTNTATASFGDGASAGNEKLQSKVAVPVAPAAAPAAYGAATLEAPRAEGRRDFNAMEVSAQDNSATDALQGVNYATTSAATAMIIRTGQAFIEVEKVDPAMLKIRQLTAQVGGYITNSAVSGGKDQIRQATIEIKIPNTQFDQAVGTLSSIGKVETVTSNAQDVGEEFVDVTARVANARRLEERLIDLLARRTGKLDEVLRVERELARVREEIERYEGRLRYLTSRVTMSTLSVNIHEPAPLIDPGSNPIAEAFRRAWQNFVAMLAALIASLGVLIPIGLIGLGGWIGYRRWIKGHRPVTA